MCVFDGLLFEFELMSNNIVVMYGYVWCMGVVMFMGLLLVCDCFDVDGFVVVFVMNL